MSLNNGEIKMNKIYWSFISIVFGISIISGATYAIVFGGSNLGIFGYPDHECYKPSKPYEPYSFDSQYEIDSYNAQVRDYNYNIETYISCIEEYLDSAKNDIERIREKMNDAIEEANSPY